ncbi:tudor domain-containing protein 5 isoform X3 [Hemicordylus capensis]|uniref:tudor domain-containing protein 5 isoform X3 n=1 Tax=Hemicordylus capensis TaxID=884348 RepID=UPI002303179B|nr:tudor domain-containing protein 5 isoform X3 [Hemicordylus capensis]
MEKEGCCINMLDQEHLINLLRKELRSLLMPIKEGLLLDQLQTEYRSMIGSELPFRALGYRSVMELVVDMPDVVQICPRGDGTVVLKVIADESTKRIASLVAKQKKRSKSHLYKSGPNSVSGSTSLRTSLSLPRRGRVPPTLPAVVKSELKELLRSSPVLLSDFDKAFVQRFGRKFEFVRYGFFSMSEVLHAASDIITIVQTRAGSQMTLKKSPLLKKQPGNLPLCKVMTQPHKTQQTSPTPVPASAVKTPSAILDLPTENRSLTPNPGSDTLIVQPKLEEPPLVKAAERMKQLEREIKAALVQKGPGGTISAELKEKIRMIAAQHPEGLLVSKLPGEFEVHFKESLPVRKLGFLNLMEFVGALNDVLHIEYKKGEQDCLIFDIDSLCLTEDEHADEITLPGSLSNKEASDGRQLPCWDFPMEESKSLETKFNVVTKMVTPHMDMKEPHIMQEIMEKEVPPDVIQDRSLYSLPLLGSSALIGLFVEYIVSPSQFYVRIYSMEASEKLEDMMIEMRRCYSSKNVADRYIMPEDSIWPGHLCCARNSENKWWYRVIIHRILNDQEVEVFYPDFGNMAVVQKSSLRFLKYSYAKLPAQAIPCSLAWTKPAEGDWTVSATLEFQKWCELKLLVGVVDEYIDGVLHLFLCDTSSDEDIYLHSVLRLEGHALICRENIPSKGFRELNPSALYLKPSPEQQIGLTEADTSLLWQGPVCDLSGTTDLEPCKDDVLFQRFDGNCDYLTSSEPSHLQGHGCFADSSSYDFQEKANENSKLEPKEQVFQPKMKEAVDTAGPEMPYLEPVYLCTEIWDENLIPLQYLKEKKNGETSDDLCLDVGVSSSCAPSDEGSKDEVQLSKELVQQHVLPERTAPLKPTAAHQLLDHTQERSAAAQTRSRCPQIKPTQLHCGTETTDISDVAERTECPSPEPQTRILDSSGEMETTDSLEATSDSLALALEEFYISIAHSQQLAEPSQIDLDVNQLPACSPQPLPSASPLQLEKCYGDTHSEKKVEDVCSSQVALRTTSHCPDQRERGHNALVFTAELQSSSTFCVPCSPTVALGASARLATSGGYFSFSLRKMKI